MAKLKITETVLRDAHQSLLATRMSMDEMRPILSEMDKIGFYSAECWGGATFDSCIRFLDEDPWERLRILRKEMPNTKLQMLFRAWYLRPWQRTIRNCTIGSALTSIRKKAKEWRDRLCGM